MGRPFAYALALGGHRGVEQVGGLGGRKGELAAGGALGGQRGVEQAGGWAGGPPEAAEQQSAGRPAPRAPQLARTGGRGVWRERSLSHAARAVPAAGMLRIRRLAPSTDRSLSCPSSALWRAARRAPCVSIRRAPMGHPPSAFPSLSWLQVAGMLRAELELSMALLGCASVRSVRSGGHVIHPPGYPLALPEQRR